jgi:hypothetical protein
MIIFRVGLRSQQQLLLFPEMLSEDKTSSLSFTSIPNILEALPCSLVHYLVLCWWHIAVSSSCFFFSLSQRSIQIHGLGALFVQCCGSETILWPRSLVREFVKFFFVAIWISEPCKKKKYIFFVTHCKSKQSGTLAVYTVIRNPESIAVILLYWTADRILG